MAGRCQIDAGPVRLRAGLGVTRRLRRASRLLGGCGGVQQPDPAVWRRAPELISARVWPSAAHDRQPYTAPGPKAGPTSGPSHTRLAPVAKVNTTTR
jgi:hypothetical protein